MKKLLGIVILGLLWCNLGFADESELNIEIKKAVEEKFDVKVKKIATMNGLGKTKQMTIKSGGRVIRTRGKRSNWKKAVVTLNDGFTIDLVQGETAS